MILRNKNNYKKIFILPFLTLITLSSTPALAQTNLSIGVAPTSKVLELDQGEVFSDEIVFWNLAEQADTYQVLVRGFRQIENQPGTAVVLTEEEDKESLYSASSWISVETTELELQPNKNTKLEYTVTVPNDATDGEYNAQIFLVSQNEVDGTGAKTFTNLGSGMPLLIKVGDEFVENAELLRFVTEKKVYEEVNIDFYTRIKNLGDTHITPVGEIIVENIFNQEVARIPFNSNKQSLLRDNVGNYVDNLSFTSYLSPSKKIMIGPMKATLLITYRSFQPGFATLGSEVAFWIVPWKLLIAILSVIIVVVTIVITRKKLSKRR